jgi:Arc/MetJ family transcription regulator
LSLYPIASSGSELAGFKALNMASNGDIIVPYLEAVMRTTLALDDELVAKAQAFTGLNEKSGLVREALKALIERESARRLARLGGSEPALKAPPRRRTTRA